MAMPFGGILSSERISRPTITEGPRSGEAKRPHGVQRKRGSFEDCEPFLACQNGAPENHGHQATTVRAQPRERSPSSQRPLCRRKSRVEERAHPRAAILLRRFIVARGGVPFTRGQLNGHIGQCSSCSSRSLSGEEARLLRPETPRSGHLRKSSSALMPFHHLQVGRQSNTSNDPRKAAEVTPRARSYHAK